jgi:hypothetical protein
MKTYNQFLTTPFSEEVTSEPPEPAKEDSKAKRQNQIKKQVLLKKLMAVRSGAGADIVASHTPEGESLDERLGGKGYKSYTDLRGKKISGDWEDSDRGAGNKAKKRAGGKVEKKSPTYKAHVLNKKVNEADDKAYKYVVGMLKDKYGSGVMTKGDKMPEPSAAQKKKNAEIRAKRSKEDHRDETEKATSGRYNDRSRSD